MPSVGAAATIEFNPMADCLGAIRTDGTKLGVNVEDGRVTIDKMLVCAESDAVKDKIAQVVAGAYTNSVKGAKETALFDIDESGTLRKQAPLNDGILNTIATLACGARS